MNVVTVREYAEVVRRANALEREVAFWKADAARQTQRLHEALRLLTEADKLIVWEQHGFGRSFADEVEASLSAFYGSGNTPTEQRVSDATR